MVDRYLFFSTQINPAVMPFIEKTYRMMEQKREKHYKKQGMCMCPVYGCRSVLPRSEMKMTWWRKTPAAVCPDCYERMCETRYIKDAYED